MSELAEKLQRRRSLNNEPELEKLESPPTTSPPVVPRRKNSVREEAQKWTGSSGVDTSEVAVARAQQLRNDKVSHGFVKYRELCFMLAVFVFISCNRSKN